MTGKVSEWLGTALILASVEAILTRIICWAFDIPFQAKMVVGVLCITVLWRMYFLPGREPDGSGRQDT